MTLTPLLILLVAVAALCGWLGYDYGTSKAESLKARDERVARLAYESAASAAAVAISKVRVNNTVLKQEVEREIKTNTFYRDCTHTPDGLRAVNAAITGKAGAIPASGGNVRAAD